MRTIGDTCTSVHNDSVQYTVGGVKDQLSKIKFGLA